MRALEPNWDDVEIPPSPDIDAIVRKNPLRICGCVEEACVFAEDERRDLDDDIDVDADYCGELSWRSVAEIMYEIEFLTIECPRVKAMDEWVAKVVIPRWKESEGRWGLDADKFNIISCVVHRVAYRKPRLKLQWCYKPALRFVMKHPKYVNPNTASSIMVKLPSPVGWIEATRDASGVLSYRYDNMRLKLDMNAINKDNYGKTWAEKTHPEKTIPIFVTPEEMEKIPPLRRHCYVYSPGVEGWVAAKRTCNAPWIQSLEGTDIEYPIYDVEGDEYGKDYGVLAPLYDGNLDKVYDRLVLHPQYKTKWIGAYTASDGKLYAYSYPSDVEVHVDISPDNFNHTWCWPPSAM